MTLLVAAVIVHDRAARQVLLLQRGPGAAHGAGLWDLPTGKQEPDEPVTHTAVRELWEETGLTVAPGQLTLAHVVHGPVGTAAPDGYLVVVFAAHRWEGEARNREPHKHADLRWVSTDELPAQLMPSGRAALRGHLTEGPGVWLAGRWSQSPVAGQDGPRPR